MNIIDEVKRLERESADLDKERASVTAANDAAIQAEQNRKYFDPAKQAAAVSALQTKKDTVMLALDKMRERKAVELATARAELAAQEVKQNAEQETQAAKAKERARVVFLQAGGLPGEFDSQWLSILATRTVQRIDERPRRAFRQNF